MKRSAKINLVLEAFGVRCFQKDGRQEHLTTDHLHLHIVATRLETVLAGGNVVPLVSHAMTQRKHRRGTIYLSISGVLLA